MLRGRDGLRRNNNNNKEEELLISEGQLINDACSINYERQGGIRELD